MFEIPANSELYDVDGTPVLELNKDKLVFAGMQDREFPEEAFVRKACKADAECFRFWALRLISKNANIKRKFGVDLLQASPDEVKKLLRKTIVAYQLVYVNKNIPTVEFIDGEFNRIQVYIKPALGGCFCTCPESSKTYVKKDGSEITKYLKCIHLREYMKITSKLMN